MEKHTKNTIIFIGTASALILFLRLFVIDFAAIRGSSMEPNMHDGDFLAINRSAYGLILPFANIYMLRWTTPERGDIVLCLNPQTAEPAVKRCVGVAGDVLRVRDGVLELDNSRIPLKFYQENTMKPESVIPEGFIFVLGDNPDVSVDSRNFGFVDVNAVLGRTMF